MTGRNISRELNKSQWSVPNEVGAASIPQGLSLVFGETSHNLPAERVQKVCQKQLIPPAGGGS